MAIAILGGFTTSTLLTLVVVPVLFSYVDNLQHSIVETVQQRSWQKTGAKENRKDAITSTCQDWQVQQQTPSPQIVL